MPPESKAQSQGKQITALTVKDVPAQTPDAAAGEIQDHVMYSKKRARGKPDLVSRD